VAPNQQANIHFSMERGMRIKNYVQVSSYIRESYQQFRGWSLSVLDRTLKYHMKIMLEDFNAKVGREDI
jgi:hypothetical protein